MVDLKGLKINTDSSLLNSPLFELDVAKGSMEGSGNNGAVSSEIGLLEG